MPNDSALAAAFADFAVIHASDGLRAALAHLRRGTGFRFIGIWRFQNGKANAAVHYDGENQEQLAATEVEDTATYCCYVRESGEPFKTANAMVDERLSTHPARDSVLAYCGAPLVGADGAIVGTLCLYDIEPRDTKAVNTELLVRVANYLAMGGHVPPYPSGSTT